MTEDPKFNDFIKSALEGEACVPPERVRAIVDAAARESRRRCLAQLAWRWVPASLAAASLAVVAAFVPFGRESSRQLDVAEAIDLLWELEDDSDHVRPSVSAGEMLLAWQEAPLNGFDSEEM